MRRFAPLLGLALVACSGGDGLDTDGEIQGTVVDAETGAPLEGVRIRTAPATETVSTAADGTYRLIAQLGVRYQVTAELDGFVAASQTFTPRVTEPGVLDFALELVRVCTPGGQRCVRGAELSAVQTCGPRGNLWTSSPCGDNQGCDDEGPRCRDLATLTVESSSGGVIRSQPVEGQPDAAINCGSACEARFFAGTEITLVAVPHAQSEFQRWNTMGPCAGSGPVCVFELDGDASVAVLFFASAYGVTVTTRGRGDGRVVSDPAGIDCGSTCNAAFDRDSMVTFTAEPAAGSVFAGWEQDCSGAGAAPTCTLTIDEAKDVRARFVPEGVAIEVTRQGTGAGTVTSAPAGIDCGADCLATFEAGAMVTLTASAAAGSTFVGWGGDCAGGAPTCELTADAPRAVTATFDGVARTLIVELGGNGRVVSTPAGIDCGATCSAPFAAGASVDLTATPDPGHVFAGWSLDCAAEGQSPTCALTLDADRRARADFVPFYLARLPEDPSCVALLHLDTSAPDEVLCGPAPGTAVIVGSYAATAGRVAALAEARLAQGADEEGYIDIARLGAAPPTATLELTVRKDGPAFAGRGRAALVSDVDLSDAAGAGVRLLLLDDGRLVVSTRDGRGGTSTATSAAATIGDGTWYHVAATIDPTSGLGLFVDGLEVARTPGPVAWTASSSTAWVGAEREGPGDAIHRLNGAVDEVRVSDVVRY